MGDAIRKRVFVLCRIGHIALASLIVITACQPDRDEASSYPPDARSGRSPVGAFVEQLDYDRLVFYPEPEANWRTFFTQDYLGDFRPGMTFSEAKTEHGEPDRRDEDRAGPFWEYHRPGSMVRISHARKGSVPFLRWWRLKVFPDPSRLEDVLHPQLTRHIPKNRHGIDVVIMNDRHSPAALVRVEEGEVAWIDWIPN